jgi:hypothetical protein
MKYLNKLLNKVVVITLTIGSANALAQFDGSDSNSEGEANQMLTYPKIETAELDYDMGGKRAFHIQFGDNINPATFSAMLNGEDITIHFSPRPGKKDSVGLNLKKGENILRLKVAGQGDSSTVYDVPEWDVDDFIIQLNGPKLTPSLTISRPTKEEKEAFLEKMRAKKDNNKK